MKNENELLWENFVASEDVFDGRLLHVKRDTVTLPNGKDATRELIRHVGAVCVVPLTEDGCVYVERQFRYPMGCVITEIPAGKLDSKSEPTVEAAKRELQEETGLTAETWIPMGEYYPTPAYSDEVITMYLARNLHSGEMNPDDDEFLCVKKVPLAQLIDEVMRGEIPDGKTQTALLKAYYLLGNK